MLQLKEENNSLNEIIKNQNESYNNKINQILEENKYYKEIYQKLINEIQKYKIEKIELVQQNNELNLKNQKLLKTYKKALSSCNSFENIQNNKMNIFSKDNKNMFINNESEEIERNKNIIKNECKIKSKEKTVFRNNSYLNKVYSDNSLSFMNKDIDNLYKKNEEIFKIIYRDSKLFKKEEEKA